MFLKYDMAQKTKPEREKDVTCKHNQMPCKANFRANLCGEGKGLEWLTFKEERKVRGFGLAYLEMSCMNVQ